MEARLHRQLQACGWPVELFKDVDRQPKVVETAEEFAREVLLGCHMNEVVVLQDGIRKLGMSDAMPPDILTVQSLPFRSV
jgi:hypothetical protein